MIVNHIQFIKVPDHWTDTIGLRPGAGPSAPQQRLSMTVAAAPTATARPTTYRTQCGPVSPGTAPRCCEAPLIIHHFVKHQESRSSPSLTTRSAPSALTAMSGPARTQRRRLVLAPAIISAR